MDKRKLVNIIIKDLEEIKILSEEVAESENDSSLVLGLALNKARLLCQEIELLCELTTKSAPIALAAEQTVVDNEEEFDDVEDHTYADPELEIINAEEDGFEQEEELPKEDELEEEELEEDEEDDFSGNEEEDEDYSLEEDQDEEMTETMVEEEDQEEPELPVEEELEEEPEEDWNKPEAQEPVAEEKPQPAESIQSTELKNGLQPGMREIHIDDMDDDDDDIQPIRFSPPAGANTRPPMREIPKPEDVISEDNVEKKFIGDKYQKERSLNDTIGENKSMDSKLANGPIPNLKAAIGLNDRFLFIREIFNNNSARYNDVIDRLDKMEHISEAVEFLKANLSMQKNEASMKFVELLKRRFTK